MFGAMMIAAVLAAAPAPAGDAAVAPASEALIDRFMTVVPDANRLDQVDRTADPLELARLSDLNPGREREITGILEEYAGCIGPVRNAELRTMLRGVARQLGDEKLSRLIAFYQSDDMRILGRIAQLGEAAMTEADRAEASRIMAAYPLEEFSRAMQPDNPLVWEAMSEDGFRCVNERDAALTRIGLAVGPESFSESGN